MIGCYARVSTEDQSLDRQLSSISEYAVREFGVEPADLDMYRDKSTGTNTSRDGYRDMIEAAEAGELEAVVCHSVSRISRSIADLERTASRLEASGVELHIVSEGLEIRPGDSDPYQKALLQLLGVFAELEASISRDRTREGIAARRENEQYHHGRPPVGFEKSDGRLIEGENYHAVVAVLELVAKGEKSKREAASELGTSRSTIGRALDRADLYGL